MLTLRLLFAPLGLALALAGCGSGFDDFSTRRPDGGGSGSDAGGGSDAWTTTRVDGGGGPGGTYHPPGYALAAAHGIEANLQVEDCRTCHGMDLRGGLHTDGSPTPECDTCHAETDPTWRTSCTFCHGGDATTGGAPPRDIDGRSDGLSFAGHTEHVSRTDHPAYACNECHEQPIDVLSLNHAFDATAGQAEVRLAGLSAGGSYDGSGGCASLYCHGNGRGSDGSARTTDPAQGCGDCHGGPGLGITALSGAHSRHPGVPCGPCHSAVVNDSNAVTNPDLHVDGTVQWSISGTGITQSGGCTGFCHGKGHFFDSW